MIDLDSVESVRDPARYFGDVRKDGTVQWSEVHRAWVVLDHPGVAAAFRDGERLSADRIGPLERAAVDRPAAFGQVVELLRGWMVFRDPPQHTRLRTPVRNAFTPRRVDDLGELVSGVVDEVVGRIEPGPVDVRRDFANPLPALVIAAALGVDGEDRESFQRWSDDLATVVFSTTPTAMPSDAAIEATGEFREFFGQLIDRERRAPSGSLLSQLITEAGDELTALELIGACTILLFAGHETTASLLANSIGLLMERPDLLAQARSNPDGDALMVEELLRVLGPTRTMFRKVAVDHERGGRRLREGDTVAVALCAANHDPEVFDHPGDVDFSRNPNPHLTFGWGLHHCVGAHLARLEARLALRALLERFGHIEAIGTIPPISGTVLAYAREPLLISVEE